MGGMKFILACFASFCLKSIYRTRNGIKLCGLVALCEVLFPCDALREPFSLRKARIYAKRRMWRANPEREPETDAHRHQLKLAFQSGPLNLLFNGI